MTRAIQSKTPLKSKVFEEVHRGIAFVIETADTIAFCAAFNRENDAGGATKTLNLFSL
jgi:hypothetical protein